MSSPLLTAKNVVKTFGAGHTLVRAVDGVSLDLWPGEVVTITGPSGSGKTTLVSILGALLRPTAGEVSIDGVNLGSMTEAELSRLRARTIGFVFQSFNLLDALSARDNILFPAHLAPGGVKAAAPLADQLLDRLGLSARQTALPKTLSGGEKQRVAIARALINQPKLIIADEPTGNLDTKSGHQVIMTLHDIARDQGHSILIVTHDQRVEEVADRVLWLEDGTIRDRKSEARIWVRDPVCKMSLDAWTSTLFVDYQGDRVHFCSEQCRTRFQQAPDDYPLIKANRPHSEKEELA